MPSEPTSDRRHALLDLAAPWRGNPALDETFEQNVREVREAAHAAPDNDPWLD